MVSRLAKLIRRFSKDGDGRRNTHANSSSDDLAISPDRRKRVLSMSYPRLSSKSDVAIHKQLKAMEFQDSPNSQRYPASGGSPRMNRYSSSRLLQPTSPFAPRIINVNDNTWCYQKVLLVIGSVGEPGQLVDGTISISRADDAYPSMQWPVNQSQWKALVYLLPGPNRLRFDFTSPQLANSGSSIHSTSLLLHMMPPLNAPPLHLVIMLGSDSPATFDAMPARAQTEGNSLDVAVRKYRMAAYMWQAFTAEQMLRNNFGRRAFRFDEEWTTGTASLADRQSGTMRPEAKIHIIRSDKTVAELRSLECAQQNPNACNKDALFSTTGDALSKYFNPLPGQTLYVSVLLLDAHWDTQHQMITGHAALGGCCGNFQLAIFGSHCMQSYPSCLEEVVPALTDCTPTDTAYCANDCEDCGSSWEMANIGIGAHMHEVGHLLGCPHQESGVMLRGYVDLHRSFVTKEAFRSKTKHPGGIVKREDECNWHRLDLLRFRGHPCFRVPCDPPMLQDDGIQAWPVEGGKVILTAPSGVSFIEIKGEGDEECHAWIECPPDTNGNMPRSVTLLEPELRLRLREDQRRGVMRISAKSCAGGNVDIDDFHKMASKDSSVRLPNGRVAYRSNQLGLSQMEGTSRCEVAFASASRNHPLNRIAVYHGFAVDGVEFFYADGSSQLFGKRGGKPGGDVFDLDVRRGEYLTGFSLRAGCWIDGVQILTSMGRRSPMFGNATGGSGATLIPPQGYNIAGVSGTCGPWLDGFAILFTR